MKTKNTLISLLILILLGVGVYWLTTQKSEAPTPNMTEETGRVGKPADGTTTSGKLKVANFSGKLEKVNTGCFVDGECYVVVDGKHITVIMGWSRETVGSVIGVKDFGDLENHIGEQVEVYAQDKSNGTYTLYGSEGFYLKVKASESDLI